MKTHKASIIQLQKQRDMSDAGTHSSEAETPNVKSAGQGGDEEGLTFEERAALLAFQSEADDPSSEIIDPDLRYYVYAKKTRFEKSRKTNVSFIGTVIIMSVFIIGGYHVYKFGKSWFPSNASTPSAGIDSSVLPNWPSEHDPLVIEFEENLPTITATGFLMLNYVEERLNENPLIKIKIQGLVNIADSRQFNLWYSEKMVAAVKKYLVDRGIAANRIEISDGMPRKDGYPPAGKDAAKPKPAIRVTFLEG
jgi:outer membrane protein OmpA-like peptidoglycan-associated protein